MSPKLTGTALRAAADAARLGLRVAALSLRRPRHPDVQWDTFWRGIADGSLPEPPLWDAFPGVAPGTEIAGHLRRAAGLMDASLPLVDAGCGSGIISRALTGSFPAVVGVDVSAAAVEAARSAHGHLAQLSFRTLDLTRDGAAAGLARELGDANVFVRGVLHVLSRRRQRRLVRSVEALLGTRGRVYLVETNNPGGALSYLQALGATAGHIPGPLRQAISTLPKPGHFGPAQRARVFPAGRWSVVAEGSAAVLTVPMEPGGAPGAVPGYWAVLARRPA